MANCMIASRSYSNWVYEICQKNGHTVMFDTVPVTEEEKLPSARFECTATIVDGSGQKLFEVKFASESKQKAKQGAAYDMIRKMGYTDDMLKEEALKPKPNGELPRSVRKANEAREAGEEITQGTSVPYVEEQMENSTIDYVSKVKKICALSGLLKPTYEDTDATGPAHLRAFKVKGLVGGRGVVPDFKSEGYATGKKQQVKNLAAFRLWEQMAPRQDEIRQTMLEWAEKSEENKKQFPEEFFFDILPEHEFEAGAAGVQNLNING